MVRKPIYAALTVGGASILSFGIWSGVPAVAGGPPMAAADPALLAAGRKSFATNCAECHTLEKDGEVTAGPNLWGLFGAKAGTRGDFPSSDAVKASGIVWTPATLDKWLAAPAGAIPGNMMPFIGIKDARERQAVIAYMAKNTSEE